MSIKNIISEYEPLIYDIEEWADEQYLRRFEPYFCEMRNLMYAMERKDLAITDDELKKILIDVPFKLFQAAEAISSMTLALEAIKSKGKQYELDAASGAITKEENAKLQIDNRLVVSSYTAVLERANRECSYARELIMGAKKVWDSRRRADTSMPVGIVGDDDSPGQDLPPYTPSDTRRTYIK